uniref:Reverse transcriptase Ty1/copia-type domain-containing protein n=1 Tax=Lactuca sativa TaxID=4236 RepID=A0A9R1XJK8_LACSA|nr:hypothetical protein LSAT_V11C300133460 [Lactuca sativa]
MVNHKSFVEAKEAKLQKISDPTSNCIWWKVQGMKLILSTFIDIVLKIILIHIKRPCSLMIVPFGRKQLMMKCHQSLRTTHECCLICLRVLNHLVANGFSKKMNVNGTVDKFKARLVIQVARIYTIRLLIALESIHNLVIHQMDVKTTFFKW